MADLYNVESPIDRVRRKNMNDTFADILRRFNNLQMQINILSGASSVEEVLTELTEAINNANTTVAELQNMVANSVESSKTATQSAIDNLKTVLATQLTIIEARLTAMQTAIDNADTATENANAATANTTSAITDARQAITDINNLIASMSYKGEYNPSTTYSTNNIVRYGKSSYVSLKTQTSVIPIDDGVNWRLIAVGGTDGTGAVSAVNNVEPNEHGNVFLLPENIDAAKKHWLDITEFGAVLDSDSSDAIQAAIDFANTGDVVFTPSGRFIVDKTIRYKPGVKLYGAASSSVWKMKDDANLAQMIYLPPSETSYNFGIEIYNLQLDGNKENNPTGGHGILLNTTYKAFVKNVKVADFKGKGIYFSGNAQMNTNTNYVKDCFVYGCDQ